MNITAVLLTISAVLVNDGNATDYKTAFEKAQSGDKPLLVLVTAQWCPPCQVMKSTTIPQLMSKCVPYTEMKTSFSQPRTDLTIGAV